MRNKRVAIIGTGISGLAAGWYLKRMHPPIDIVYFEKKSRAGGWLHTDHSTGFHFEKGPRAFKVDRCPATLKLITELGMDGDVVWSEAKPHHRYLWHNDELQRFPTSMLAFVCSPLTKGFIRALLSEWRQPQKSGDETVWEFVLRRFNYDVARLFFDPLVVGIFGGDIRKISVKACFPVLKAWEEQYGSVTKGFLCTRWAKRKNSTFSQTIPYLPLSAIFSLRGGMESLSQTLVARIGAPIFYGEEVLRLDVQGEGMRVHTTAQQLDVDEVILACPAKEAGGLLQPHCQEMGKELLGIHSQSIAVISVGYDEHTLPVEGFGYLTSTYSNEDILGVVFDSSVFHQHNRVPQETRLTVKIESNGLSNDEYAHLALCGIRRHLNIARTPTSVHCLQAINAIPQYRVGHLEKIAELEKQLRHKLPHCYLAGNYINGVSVDACITRAHHVITNQFAKSTPAA